MTTFSKTYWRSWAALLLGAALISLTVTLFPRSPEPATPAVTWTPSALSQSISGGDTVTVSVSFTASRELNNIVVRVSPELEPLVEVGSPTLGSIIEGETVPLNVNISIPASALPETFEGTIQLRANNSRGRAFARPLPVRIEIIEWPTLTNASEGYSISHPASFVATVQPDGTAVFEELTEGSAVIGMVVILVHPNPGGLSLLDFVAQRNNDLLVQGCNDLVGCQLLENPTPFVVDGRAGLRFGPIGLSEAVAFVEGDGVILELTTPDSVEEFEEMVSTLEFQ